MHCMFLGNISVLKYVSVLNGWLIFVSFCVCVFLSSAFKCKKHNCAIFNSFGVQKILSSCSANTELDGNWSRYSWFVVKGVTLIELVLLVTQCHNYCLGFSWTAWTANWCLGCCWAMDAHPGPGQLLGREQLPPWWRGLEPGQVAWIGQGLSHPTWHCAEGHKAVDNWLGVGWGSVGGWWDLMLLVNCCVAVCQSVGRT